MRSRWYEWGSRLKSIGKEYRVTRFAVDRLAMEVRRDSAILPQGLEAKYLGSSQQLLEGTYIVRMYAEFETAIRLFWAKSRDTNPPMKDLVDGIASSRYITFDITDPVHLVRSYRNCLVHEREVGVAPISIETVESHLSRFLRRLGKNW